MSTDWLAAAWRLQVKGPTEKSVLIALADRADEAGRCWPSHRDLILRTQLSDRGVRNALAQLAEDGFIKKQERFRDGRQTSNVYHLTFPTWWQEVPGGVAGGATPEVAGGATRGTVSRGTVTGTAHARSARGAVRRVRPDEDQDGTEAPAMGASRQTKTNTARNETAEARGVSGLGLARRLNTALKLALPDYLEPVNVSATAGTINVWLKAGASPGAIDKAITRFAKTPGRYIAGDQEPWKAFISSRNQLLRENIRVEKAGGGKTRQSFYAEEGDQ